MQNKKSLRQILLPVEHGSWGLTLEPLALGLIVAFSLQGLYLAIASFFFFLAHQPVRIFLGKNENRKLTAFGIALVYIAISLFCLFKSFAYGNTANFFPFLTALLLMFAFLVSEIFLSRNDFLNRLIAPVAIDLIAMSLVLLGGMSFYKSTVFFLIISARSVQSSFYIHEQLKKIKKKNFRSAYVHLTGLIYLAFAIYFAVQKYSPFLTVVSILILIVRAWWGLTTNKKLTVKQSGILEFVYGILFVTFVALGYLFNI